MEQISLKEYGKLIHMSKTGILKRRKKNHYLPGVKKFDLIGKSYVLTVNMNELKNNLVANRKPFKLAQK